MSLFCHGLDRAKQAQLHPSNDEPLFMFPSTSKSEGFIAATDKYDIQQLWGICCSHADFLWGLQSKWYFQFEIQTDGERCSKETLWYSLLTGTGHSLPCKEHNSEKPGSPTLLWSRQANRACSQAWLTCSLRTQLHYRAAMVNCSANFSSLHITMLCW